jgi:assimilatory nitrate reductase catalytic subunit
VVTAGRKRGVLFAPEKSMAQLPVTPTSTIRDFGPHLAFSSGQRLDRGVEPDRVVKTHCCF